MPSTRRDLLRATAGFAAASLPGAAFAQEGKADERPMPLRELGRTELVVPAFLTLRQAYADAVARSLPEAPR